MVSPKVVAVVLNYKRRQETVECVHSLLESSHEPIEIAVVDNDSSDGSVEFVRSACPNVLVIDSGKNLGFAGGMNLGIRRALRSGAVYVLVLNSDTLVEKDSVTKLVHELEKKPNAGVACGTLFYYPDISRVWYAGGSLVYWRASAFSKHMVPKGGVSTAKVQRVSFIPGCALMFRASSLIDGGLFDERYFMYEEDAEISARFLAHGFELLYVPNAIFYHRLVGETLNPLKIYYGMRNRLLFLRTAPRVIDRVVGTTYFFIVLAVKLIVWRLRKPLFCRAATIGVVDFFAGRFYEGRGTTVK